MLGLSCRRTREVQWFRCSHVAVVLLHDDFPRLFSERCGYRPFYRIPLTRWRLRIDRAAVLPATTSTRVSVQRRVYRFVTFPLVVLFAVLMLFSEWGFEILHRLEPSR